MLARVPKKKTAKIVATTMRFDPAIKAALEKAATDDRRTSTSLAMKILEDWLREHKYL